MANLPGIYPPVVCYAPPEPQFIGNTQCFATFLPFRAPASSFLSFFLFSDLLCSSFLFCLFPPLLFHLSTLSEVWLLNFLRLYLSIDRSIDLSICLNVYLSICLNVYLSIYQSIIVPIYQSIHLYIYQSINILSINRSIYLSIYQSINLSIHLSIYTYILYIRIHIIDI